MSCVVTLEPASLRQRAASLREKGARVRTAATSGSDPDIRSEMLKLAAEYDELADQAERMARDFRS